MLDFDDARIRELENLDLLARQVVEGFIIGLHKSPFHGFSVEFAEHRLYNQGEATRNIDWKVFARTDKLFTKKYEEETNLRCQIVIDASSSMYFPEPDKKNDKSTNKIRFSILAAASLMNLLRKQRDAFGLSIFKETLERHTPCKTSNTHYRLMLTYLDELIRDQAMNITTNAAESIHEVAMQTHKRSLVAIFSDMFDRGEDMDALFSSLQHLKHKKHEVMLFHTIDHSLEMNFDFENRPHLFIDMETGERIRLQSNSIKEKYREKYAAVKEEIMMRCLQYKIDYIDVDVRDGYNKVLQSYLVKRSKMR